MAVLGGTAVVAVAVDFVIVVDIVIVIDVVGVVVHVVFVVLFVVTGHIIFSCCQQMLI